MPATPEEYTFGWCRSSKMKSICRVCQSQHEKPAFTGVLLSREISYYDCEHCGYVQTQEPDWLEQAYSSAINFCDTGI
ncbi:hypothetical protein LC593_37180, partial [Nostoc sp. CHAB 5844]|nr:hypothetical protein [Nostoc sp. CHAB 5844]